MNDLLWDDVDIPVEEITETEARNIETGDSLPIGLYHAVVVEGELVQIDYTAYSCLGINLKHKVLQVLEVVGKKVKGDEYEHFEGKFIYDELAFQHEKEKPGSTKRRKLVALRLGLIQPGGVLTKSIWQNVVGKEANLRLSENKYMKDGVEKIGRPKVGFGYESIDKSGEAAKEEDWAEI